MDYTFGGKYKLDSELGVGGCGSVYSGVHTIAGKEVAIKLEPAIPHPSYPSTHQASGSTPLQQESRIYKTLQGGPGVPWMMWSGKKDGWNVMVIDLLGPSLEDLFRRCNRHFSLKTVLLLADQMLTRIEYIHSRGLIHRDIKPANFVMSSREPSESCLNVIDFGLAKKYRDSKTGYHIPYNQEDQHGVGTSLFAAINTHQGVECSRRDDLESLAYVLIYFLRGSLPWRKLKGSTTAQTWSLILAKKLECESLLTVGLPTEFEILYTYVRGLEFGDLPDYDGLRKLLRTLGERAGVKYDGGFDWIRDKDRKPRHFGEIGQAVCEKEEVKRVRRCRACEAAAAAEAADEVKAW